MAMRVLVLVGTKKGAFILESDLDRRSWKVRGPSCEGYPIQDINADPVTGTLYAGGGSVWVANTVDGTVSRIDPATDRVTATIPVGPGPQSVAIGEGWRIEHPVATTHTTIASPSNRHIISPLALQPGAPFWARTHTAHSRRGSSAPEPRCRRLSTTPPGRV